MKLAEKSRKKNIRDIYYSSLHKHCKFEREKRYQLKRTAKWLRKTNSYFPDRMRKKLQKMPNNKGYIWRGIYYYGERPKNKREPILMFEQKRNI